MKKQIFHDAALVYSGSSSLSSFHSFMPNTYTPLSPRVSYRPSDGSTSVQCLGLALLYDHLVSYRCSLGFGGRLFSRVRLAPCHTFPFLPYAGWLCSTSNSLAGWFPFHWTSPISNSFQSLQSPTLSSGLFSIKRS